MSRSAHFKKSSWVTSFLIDLFGEMHKAKSEEPQLNLQAEHAQTFKS